MPALAILILFAFLPASAAAGPWDDAWQQARGDVSSLRAADVSYPLLVGGSLTAGAFFLDHDVRERALRSRSGANDVIASVGNAAGHPVVDLSAAALLHGAGMAGKNARLAESSFTAFESVFFATVVTETLSFAVGRSRPDRHDGSRRYEPFGNDGSLPSSHAASSMAFFSTYARYYPSSAYVMYAMFGATAFGRIYDDRHFLSDVVLGGTIGYALSSYLYERHQKGRKTTAFTPFITVNGSAVYAGGTFRF